MKTEVKLLNSFKNGNKQVVQLENQGYCQLKLEENKLYSIEIKEIKSKRSIQQNKLLWAIINEIAKVDNDDEMNIYCSALEQANASYVWLKGLEETKQELLKAFRAIKITRYEEENNKKIAIFKCYYGSSKFSVKEMNVLIDIVKSWAYEKGIDTDLLV